MVRRIGQVIEAIAGLRKLNRTTEACRNDSAALVRSLKQFAGGYFMPIQMDEEIIELMEVVRSLEPKVVMEIGTHWGGTLHFWTRVAPDDATIISMDLPGGKFGGGYSSWKKPLYQSFERASQDLHLLRCDSHEASSLDSVNAILAGRKIDFLLIDGDHSYEGVKRDWEMYSPLVRSGGLVAFHDVAKSYDETQVERFWRELSPTVRSREFCYHPDGLYGIGVVEV